MNRFTAKALNLILIIAVIVLYNGRIDQRKSDESAAKKEADLKAQKEQLENNLSEQEAERASVEAVLKAWQASLNEDAKSGQKETQGETSSVTETSEEEDSSLYRDGEYEGSAKGFGGEIVMKVTIENGEIADIEIESADKEDRAYLESASSIVNDMLDAQSADVDTVSGATFSSTGIREATKQALEKAMK